MEDKPEVLEAVLKETVDLESIPIEEVFENLRCSKDGLTSSGAAERLTIFGHNKLEEVKERKFLKFLGFMWNPLSWVMEAAAIMAIALANGGGKPPDWQDFVGIITLLVINSTISFIEENNAGNAAAALMARLAPKAKLKLISGDQLAIGKETGRRLGMGTNMYPSSALLGQNKDESIAALPIDELIEKADGFAGVFPALKNLLLLTHLQAVLILRYIFKVAFTRQKDFGKEQRELKWAHAQRTLHGLEVPDTKMFNDKSNFTELNQMAEEAKRRAEIARLRELHTLKGHVESVVRLKGLDIDTIQQSYTV
ncbi:hypothetical protein AG4045_015757 [Apium graveolens]|uniref:Cation-transporting P-type ATPase N-terminal domain-containing protein n=1 Tax=Apium graveolens TaxID=4045 RepID=A0A6L5B8N3_APIGR|nr:hypothetical protein AG4045_015757 [Apium graveolens]